MGVGCNFTPVGVKYGYRRKTVYDAFCENGKEAAIMNREKKITVFGDSIGKGVFTDGGKIEVIKDNAVKLFEEWKGIEIDNRSGYGQSLKRLLDKGVIEKYIAGLDKSKR